MDTLKLAKKSIHFMAFSFTHEGIGSGHAGAKRRGGRDCRRLREDPDRVRPLRLFQDAAKPSWPVYLDANPRNMHHKVIIIDGEIVIFGSFNFSDSADKSNDENLLIIYNRAVAAKFEEEFQRVVQVAKQAGSK